MPKYTITVQYSCDFPLDTDQDLDEETREGVDLNDADAIHDIMRDLLEDDVLVWVGGVYDMSLVDLKVKPKK